MYVNSHKNIQTLRFYFRMNMGFLSYLIITFILIGSNLYYNYFLNFAFDNRSKYLSFNEAKSINPEGKIKINEIFSNMRPLTF